MTRQQALDVLKRAIKEWTVSNPDEANYMRAILHLAYADMPDSQREATAIVIKRLDALEDTIRGLLAKDETA